MKKKIFKLILWLLKPKKIAVYIVVGSIAWAGITFYNYKVEQALQEKGIVACQRLHDYNVNKFSELTGLTADNVVYGVPTVEKARNLRVFDFTNLRVGNEIGKFTCSYNTVTGIATDKTKKLSDSNNGKYSK